jgi:hypothetical protein
MLAHHDVGPASLDRHDGLGYADGAVTIDADSLEQAPDVLTQVPMSADA